MKVFAENLRRRASTLGLSNAEVARRAKVPERTYANYVLDRTEPSLAALVRIAGVLQMSVDLLLSPAEDEAVISHRDTLLARLRAGAEVLDEADLESIAAQIDAVNQVRASSRKQRRS